METVMKLTLSVIKADIGSMRLHNIAGKYTGKDDPVMRPMSELEYTGIMEKLQALEGRFTVRR